MRSVEFCNVTFLGGAAGSKTSLYYDDNKRRHLRSHELVREPARIILSRVWGHLGFIFAWRAYIVYNTQNIVLRSIQYSKYSAPRTMQYDVTVQYGIARSIC